MNYEKLGFENGQVLKAEHLNHMEEGIFTNAIPVYKEEDITTEMAIEFAKNKTVFLVESLIEKGTSSNNEHSDILGRILINTYSCRESYTRMVSADGCGDDYEEHISPALLLGNIRAALTANNVSNVLSFEITDEIVDEIRAAWGL